jgi:hypothetical protein
MKSVFLLQHMHGDKVKVIGIYGTRLGAEAAIKRLADKPGFRDHPRLVQKGGGFYVDEYRLDKDQWSDGYISTTDA